MDAVNNALAHTWVVLVCASVGAGLLLWSVYLAYRDDINAISDDASWAEWWHERIMDDSDDGRDA